MINLFFVIHDYSGARTYANELLGWLSSQVGIAVHKVYWESTCYKEYTVAEEDRLVAIHLPCIERGRNSLEKYSSRCIDLMTPILTGKQNLVFHLNNNRHVKFGILARDRFGLRMIYTLHFLPNYFSYLASGIQMPENLSTKGDEYEKLMVSEADHVICVTHFGKESIQKWYGVSEEKVTAIHNGIGFKKHCKELTQRQKDEIRESLGFSKKEQILLFVGKIEQRKGIKHLIAVFNKLAKTILKVQLVIVGDGEYSKVFNDATGIWRRITLTGKIAKQDIVQFYQIADIGIIPSIFEQCSYVALEMMQYGLPVVVTNAPGLNELYEDHKNALIAPLRNTNSSLMELEVIEDELERLIVELLADENLRKEIGQNARECWASGYSANYMGVRTLKIYSQLSSSNR